MAAAAAAAGNKKHKDARAISDLSVGPSSG